jgi:hypothetical protein
MSNNLYFNLEDRPLEGNTLRELTSMAEWLLSQGEVQAAAELRELVNYLYAIDKLEKEIN